MTLTEKEAERVFENNKDIHLDLHSKIHDGKINFDGDVKKYAAII
mgnify:FL=1